MVERFEIRNFKVFRSIVVPLSPITVIGGNNSVGKSTLLEALFLFFDRHNVEMMLRQYGWRGVGKVYAPPDRFFTPSFHDFNDDASIELFARVGGADRLLKFTYHKNGGPKQILAAYGKGDDTAGVRTDDKPLSDVRLAIEYTSETGKQESSELVFKDKGLMLNDKNEGDASKVVAVYLSPRVRPSVVEDCDRFGELDALNEAGSVVEFLTKFDARVTDISTISTGEASVLHADIGLKRKVPIPFMGDGLSMMLTTFLAITKARDGVLLVDDIGAYIHHSVLGKFWAELAVACRRFNCQLIGTTHSYECLRAAADGLAPPFQDEFGYIRLEGVKEDIAATAYSFAEFAASLESNWEVR
jgi:hypothetical protein